VARLLTDSRNILISASKNKFAFWVVVRKMNTTGWD
jgi:hypothetical protein